MPTLHGRDPDPHRRRVHPRDRGPHRNIDGRTDILGLLGTPNDFNGAYLTGSKVQPVVFTDDLSRVKLWTPHKVYGELGAAPTDRAAAHRALFAGQIDSALIEQIRQATHQGMALGNDRFKQDVEHLTQRRVRPLNKARTEN